eukprot:9444448-Prorocentrum_lima.AAC.1
MEMLNRVGIGSDVPEVKINVRHNARWNASDQPERPSNEFWEVEGLRNHPRGLAEEGGDYN